MGRFLPILIKEEEKIMTKKKKDDITTTPTEPTTLKDEDKILGKKEKFSSAKNVDYEDIYKKYKVTNIALGNTPIIVRGNVIEAFIGSHNLKAREELKAGSKSVITHDLLSNKQLYKIEVL